MDYAVNALSNKMTLIKKHEELADKKLEDVNDMIKWANENKRTIDIINISYKGIGIIKTQPVCILWFKTIKRPLLANF